MRLTMSIPFVEQGYDEDDAVWFGKEVDRPYTRVPAPGEMVSLGDDPGDLGRQWIVDTVMWSNAGVPDLWLAKASRAVATDPIPEELEAAGFVASSLLPEPRL